MSLHPRSYRNVLKLCVFGVGEVDLWLPYCLHEVRIIQVQRIKELWVVKTRVKPPLPQIKIDLIVLENNYTHSGVNSHHSQEIFIFYNIPQWNKIIRVSDAMGLQTSNARWCCWL